MQPYSAEAEPDKYVPDPVKPDPVSPAMQPYSAEEKPDLTAVLEQIQTTGAVNLLAPAKPMSEVIAEHEAEKKAEAEQKAAFPIKIGFKSPYR